MKYIKLFYPIMYSIYSAELKLGTLGGSLPIEFRLQLGWESTKGSGGI